MTAYYSENDPFAADWLRNLIAEGLIADGYGNAINVAQAETFVSSYLDTRAELAS